MTEAWLEALGHCRENNTNCVLVTVIDTKGSTPRDCGSKILVTADRQYDSIGGGHLELRCITLARELLINNAETTRLAEFSLGPSLGQCCGGHVSVLLEKFAAREIPLYLFGAGHVADALTDILAKLPLRVQWIDNREHIGSLPEEKASSVIYNDDPLEAVEDAPEGAFYLVMTHDHSLDLQLVESILKRGDSRYCGLIGSASKSARFRKRLQQRGLNESAIAQLDCPAGFEGLSGKRPMEIAVAMAAKIISVYQSDADNTKPSLNRRFMESSI